MPTKNVPFTNFKAGTDDGLDEGEFVVYPSTFTRTPDAYGDVVAKGAFTDTLAAWKESGNVMPGFYGHRLDDPDYNVAEATDMGEDDHGWWVKGRFDLDNPKANTVYKQVKGRRLSQLSFSFDCLDAGPVELTDGQKANELRKLQVYEFSFVPIGANQDTSVVAVKDAAEAMTTRQAKADDGLSDENLARLRQAYTAIGKVIDAASNSDEENDDSSNDGDGQDGKTAPAVKGAIGAGSGPSSTSDDEWDGPGNEAKLSNDAGADTYKQAYAWVDPGGNADKKASYKFVHHFISDDGAVGAASTQACVTGIGVLNGGRGGTNVPDADRQGVYNHLAKHLKDAGVDDIPELESSPSGDGDGDSRSHTDDAAGAKQEAGQPGSSAVANTPTRVSGVSAGQPQGDRSAKAAARLQILKVRSR